MISSIKSNSQSLTYGSGGNGMNTTQPYQGQAMDGITGAVIVKVHL